MEIRLAAQADRACWMRLNPHADEESFARHVRAQTGYLILDGDVPVGVMQMCMFWDHLPFLSLIYLPPQNRGRGYGRTAMTLWEQAMKAQGHTMVLTSTQADESAQHFYRRLGYVDCGALVLGGTPLDQPLEIFLRKVL